MGSEQRHYQSEIEFALLGYLFQRPMHAYEIHRHLVSHDGLGLVWNLDQSRLYAQLAQLERRGFVAATTQPQVGRPARRVLRLTETGRDTFLAWLHAPVAGPRHIRMEFMAKLVFLRTLNPNEAAVLLERQRVLAQEWLTALQCQLSALEDTQSFEWMVFQFRIGQVQATLDWIATCTGALAEDAGDSDTSGTHLALSQALLIAHKLEYVRTLLSPKSMTRPREVSHNALAAHFGNRHDDSFNCDSETLTPIDVAETTPP